MARDKSFCEKDTLDKLTDVFWQQGYHGASMDDLLKQSGLSRSSLYATYGDKRTVFLQTLNAYITKQAAYLASGLKKWETTTDAVRDLYDYVISSPENGCTKGCFVVNVAIEWGTSDDEIKALTTNNRNTIIQTLTTLINQDQQSGKIASSLPADGLAAFIFNNLTGLQVGVRSGIPKNELQQIRDIVLAMLG